MDFLIKQDPYYTLEHSYSCAIPGYLVLTPTVEVASVSKLPARHLYRLGSALSQSVEVVEKVIKPENVYCAQFGEEHNHLHFHIFPRTLSITAEYLKEYPDQKELIHGPILFDWAREHYKLRKQEVWNRISAVITDLKKCLSQSEKQG